MQSTEQLKQASFSRKLVVPQRKSVAIEDNRPAAAEQAEMINAIQEYSANDVMRRNPLQLQKNSISTASSSNRVVQGYFAYEGQPVSEEILNEIEELLPKNIKLAFKQKRAQEKAKKWQSTNIIEWLNSGPFAGALKPMMESILSVLEREALESPIMTEDFAELGVATPANPVGGLSDKGEVEQIDESTDIPDDSDFSVDPQLDDPFQIVGQSSQPSHIPPEIEEFIPFPPSPRSIGTHVAKSGNRGGRRAVQSPLDMQLPPGVQWNPQPIDRCKYPGPPSVSMPDDFHDAQKSKPTAPQPIVAETSEELLAPNQNFRILNPYGKIFHTYVFGQDFLNDNHHSSWAEDAIVYNKTYQKEYGEMAPHDIIKAYDFSVVMVRGAEVALVFGYTKDSICTITHFDGKISLELATEKQYKQKKVSLASSQSGNRYHVKKRGRRGRK